MKAIQLKEYVQVAIPSLFLSLPTNPPPQGPSDLKVTDLPTPSPKENEYLIAIHASATNFFDLLQIRGKYQHQPAFPWVSGSEFSGVVLQAPSNGKYKVGDKVFGALQGAYATHICCPEKVLKPVPEGWSFADAAGLFVTAPTSYAALVTRAGIKKGRFSMTFTTATTPLPTKSLYPS